MDIKDIDVFVASEEHLKYAPIICQAIETAAYARGTGIAKRKPEYIENKMKDGKAIIALPGTGGLQASAISKRGNMKNTWPPRD